MSDKNKGIYHKFDVIRTDGKSEVNQKHYRCDYFVIDIVHDKYASAALYAYANECEKEYPLLANDLRKRILINS